MCEVLYREVLFLPEPQDTELPARIYILPVLFALFCPVINQQKAQAAIKFQRQKEEIVKKFDNLMKQNKEIEPETIKELFPEDQELYNKIYRYKMNYFLFL